MPRSGAQQDNTAAATAAYCKTLNSQRCATHRDIYQERHVHPNFVVNALVPAPDDLCRPHQHTMKKGK